MSRRNGIGKLIGTIVVALIAGTLRAETTASPVETDSAAVLWTSMHDAGMIDDVQLQSALTTGHLPGGSTVQNSPVATNKQASLIRLGDQKVITAQELAYLLFKGKIPEMTADKTKAFEDLAKVYQPDRKKRLTYAVRLAHQKVELIRLNKRSSKEWKQRHDDAVARATREGQHQRSKYGGRLYGSIWSFGADWHPA